MAINIVKGTHDIIGDEARGFEHIEMVLKAFSEVYAFNQIRTPIIEHTELFTRSVGESSDIVRKEMYTFLDKGERSITLRPEITAGIIRAIVSSKLYATSDLPIKSYYLGPTFRYERPQLGRYRQFNQFGVESVGITSTFHDLEVILLGYDCLKMLGFENIILKINTLGDQQSRDNYREALKKYFEDKVDAMCEDCQARYKTNPLRILDCKVQKDQEMAKSAPKISDYLTAEAKERFTKITAMLDFYEIKYIIDHNLVRGLDYYSHVIFEFHYITAKGTDLGALGAGGHYDNLVKEIGGPDMSGVGFAFGIERLHALMAEEGLLKEIEEKTDVYLMPVGKEQIEFCFHLAETLRANAYRTEICLESKNLPAQFKRAERCKASIAIIIGEEEVKKEEVVVKNLHTQTQVKIPLKNLPHTLNQMFNQAEEHDHDCHCGCEHEKK